MTWKKIKSTKKADFPLFKVFEDIVELPNGLKLDYYKVEKIPVVVVLPVSHNGIVMVKQYRYPIKKDSLELPAGHVWKGEDPKECAARELKEETGFTAGKIEKVLEYHPSTEYANQVYHIYIANELKKGENNLEKYELIDVEVITKESVIKKIIDGEITDGRTITSIFLAHYLDRI